VRALSVAGRYYVAGVSPLKRFQVVYFAVFAVTMVVGFTAPEYIRVPLVVLGGLLAAFGFCLTANLFGFASEASSKAGSSRWTPPAFADVRLVRAIGVFFLLGGVGFAVQALLTNDL
jgi:hypothetical protein